MPPKPLAEDLARKKAERDKAKKAEELLGIMERPGGFEQAVAAVKDPVGTVKQLGRVAKETFVDPVNRAQKALNPFEDLTPMQRATGIAEGALVAADFLTPGVPEGSIARSLQREAMEKALDREVAGYAASGGGQRFRGVLGIHGSPVPGLGQIEPQLGSANLRDDSVAWAWRALPTGQLEMPDFNPAKLYENASAYSKRPYWSEPGDDPTVYIARFPKQGDWFAQQANPTEELSNMSIFSAASLSNPYLVSTEPGRVLATMPGGLDQKVGQRQLRSMLQGFMTPAEKLAFRKARLDRQLKRTERKWRGMPNRYEDEAPLSVFQGVSRRPKPMTPAEEQARRQFLAMSE